MNFKRISPILCVAALSLISGCSPDIVMSAGTAAELKRQELESAKRSQDLVLKKMESANQQAAQAVDRAASMAEEAR